ncbi:hypothetical protein F7725_024999 [Dissostichus mawsoni]|uniref:Uncharacterized protein n=1 Tax=Dissostichus mawsoni TaxID=36200 RepID=A0A7J5X9X0_DISMA|nr:hypothetical protein F7725_024999 [Dissostichus mawsoni]
MCAQSPHSLCTQEPELLLISPALTAATSLTLEHCCHELGDQTNFTWVTPDWQRADTEQETALVDYY